MVFKREVRRSKTVFSLHKYPSRAALEGAYIYKESRVRKLLLWADNPGLEILRELNRGVHRDSGHTNTVSIHFVHFKSDIISTTGRHCVGHPHRENQNPGCEKEIWYFLWLQRGCKARGKVPVLVPAVLVWRNNFNSAHLSSPSSGITSQASEVRTVEVVISKHQRLGAYRGSLCIKIMSKALVPKLENSLDILSTRLIGCAIFCMK